MALTVSNRGADVDTVTATGAEVNAIAGVVAGTVTASKAVVVDANKAVDVLAVADLKLGSGAGTSVTSTAAELNLADGSVAGTAVASKLACLGANKELDEFHTAALYIGSGAGTLVGATAAEINATCDVSGYTQAITAAGAVTADGSKQYVTLSGGAYAITLAAPGAGAAGKLLMITYVGGDTDAVTLDNTEIIGGSAGSTYTFNADNETLVLIGGNGKWIVLKEHGVTIA